MASRPNVVLILVDDMGFNDLGIMRSEIRTRNIDALAMMRFGGGGYGPAMKWSSDKRAMGEHFARDCRAPLLPTRKAYDRASEKARPL